LAEAESLVYANHRMACSKPSLVTRDTMKPPVIIAISIYLVTNPLCHVTPIRLADVYDT